MKLKKSFLCLLVLALTYSPCALSVQEGDIAESLGTEKLTAYEEPTKSISREQYIGGGVVSIIPGFGLGHALQGRYMERGWIFTASEIAAFGGYVAAGYYGVKLFFDSDEEAEPEFSTLMALHISFAVIFIGLKAWEIYDAWDLPSDYKVVDNSFKIQPLVYYDRGNTSLGLSLQYQF